MNLRSFPITLLVLQVLAIPITVAQSDRLVSKSSLASSFASKKNTSELQEMLSNTDMNFAFRENAGQWGANILYQGSSEAGNVYFLKDGLSLCHVREAEGSEEKNNLTELHKEVAEEYSYLVWNIHFLGMNSKVNIYGAGDQESKTNYLLGRDADKHVKNVKDHRLIRYDNVYKNIDLQYYIKDTDLKYDFILKPGSDINDIQLACEGIEKLKTNSEGEVEVFTKWGTLIERRPYCYQLINGTKREIIVNYILRNDTTFGFRIDGEYDPAYAVIIDPVTLKWGTFVGGNSTGAGYLFDIVVDGAGNIYGTGWYRNNFPTTAGVYDPTYNGSSGNGYFTDYKEAVSNIDAFVFKLDPTGTILIWATYIGGNKDNEAGWGIDLDAAGNIYVCGYTQSTDFPVTAGAYDNTFNNWPPTFPTNFITRPDAFVLKLNPAGSTLMYSTFIGGWYQDYAMDLAVDNAGKAFVVGHSFGAQGLITTPGCIQPNPTNSEPGWFVVLAATGASANYSTFLSGGAYDWPLGVEINAAGEAFITGFTWISQPANPFPTTAGAFQTAYGGSDDLTVMTNYTKGDAFVCRINPLGGGMSDLVYSTFLGGSRDDGGVDITLDNLGNAYVVGWTESSDFPVTAGSYDTSFNGPVANTSCCGGVGGGDLFIAKISPSGNNLVYSTYLGGTAADANTSGYWIFMSAIVINPAGEAFITSFTGSPDYPVTNCAFQTTQQGAIQWDGAMDGVLSKLSADGKNLLYSSYVGGSLNNDYGASLAVVGSNPCDQEVIMGITTHSANFPTLGPAYKIAKGNTTAVSFGTARTGELDQPVIVKFAPKVNAGFTRSGTLSCNSLVQFTDTTNQCGLWVPLTTWAWDFGDGTTSSVQHPTHVYSAGGTYNVKLTVGCPASSITIPVTISGVGCCVSSLGSTVNAIDAKCGSNGSGSVVAVTGGTSPYTYSWSPSGGTGVTAGNLPPGSYSVLITDALNCKTAANINVGNLQLAATVSVNNVACNVGNNGTATVAATGGVSSYTYNWNNAQTAQTATGLSVGNYTVTIRDGAGCSITRTVTITTIPMGTLKISAVDVTCGDGGSATINTLGGTSPYSYLWSNGSTANKTTGLIAGTYTVTVTDSNGCTASSTASVTGIQTVFASFTQSPGTVCIGTTVNFTNTGTTGTGVTYSWFTNPGFASGSTEHFSYTFLSARTYTVQHVVTSGGCSAVMTSTITVTNCSGPTVTATGSSVCPGSCATVTSSGTGGISPYTFSWSNNATTQNISPCPIITTTYTVTIRDAGGNTSASTALVTVNPVVTVNATVSNINCNGGSGSSTASVGSGTSPYTYNWNNGQTTQTATGLTAGNYTVTVNDSKNCTATAAVTIISPPALSGQFTKGTANCTGCGCREWIMVAATGGTSPYTYSWPDGYTNRYKNKICPGSYAINIKDKNGCSVNVNLNAP
ncbi:MAG: SBBP repeat-containing protein [Bacteroidetes bacterium]|nr:SBBP repeat-containing protein [Bacteroidota bacterium]